MMKCKHAYHEANTDKEKNEVCLYCGRPRTQDEKTLKEMFK